MLRILGIVRYWRGESAVVDESNKRPKSRDADLKYARTSAMNVVRETVQHRLLPVTGN